MSEQSSRENFVEQNPQDAVKPWAASQPSDDQASTVPQDAYLGTENQTEAPIAVTTAYPKFPLRWLYGVRIVVTAVSLWLSVRILYKLVTTILDGYVSLALAEIIEAPQVIGYPVYEIMQIIAAILYLRSKGLGYILGVNILGLIVQLPSLPKLIENLLRLDIFFEYAKASTYLDWGLYIIDVALCIFFIIIVIREYSRRQKMKTAQAQPAYAAAPHTSAPQVVVPHNPEAPAQAPTAQAPTAQTQNPPEQPLM
ncbi:hypothetical protein CRM92_09825 [Rothia dentocariosa]|uniref:Uncharacterized protein n=1 Tax=Rothia dentocariosa TaxID=2047 RepID=A0A2A8D3Q2_9MICC|nr:hypothetical protein [Rothia dentocariosa]PEN15569.1 hypothetical protein CRM92_09825 [Rothia dentocariosa]